MENNRWLLTLNRVGRKDHSEEIFKLMLKDTKELEIQKGACQVEKRARAQALRQKLARLVPGSRTAAGAECLFKQYSHKKYFTGKDMNLHINK